MHHQAAQVARINKECKLMKRHQKQEGYKQVTRVAEDNSNVRGILHCLLHCSCDQIGQTLGLFPATITIITFKPLSIFDLVVLEVLQTCSTARLT